MGRNLDYSAYLIICTGFPISFEVKYDNFVKKSINNCFKQLCQHRRCFKHDEFRCRPKWAKCKIWWDLFPLVISRITVPILKSACILSLYLESSSNLRIIDKKMYSDSFIILDFKHCVIILSTLCKVNSCARNGFMIYKYSNFDIFIYFAIRWLVIATTEY